LPAHRPDAQKQKSCETAKSGSVAWDVIMQLLTFGKGLRQHFRMSRSMDKKLWIRASWNSTEPRINHDLGPMPSWRFRWPLPEQRPLTNIRSSSNISLPCYLLRRLACQD